MLRILGGKVSTEPAPSGWISVITNNLNEVKFKQVPPQLLLKPISRIGQSLTQREKFMPKPREEKPLMIKCPNCHQTHEPDFNETTKRYVCPLCAASVDMQVIIEKKKRGIK